MLFHPIRLFAIKKMPIAGCNQTANGTSGLESIEGHFRKKPH
jgi:hypothetical protein